MRIIEKKCPNCGASLSFDSDDKEAKCNYCGQEFIIENDKKESNERLTAADFTLQKKLFKAFGITHTIITIFSILIFLGVFIGMGFGVYSMFKTMDNSNIGINDINNQTIEMINSNSINKIKTWNQIPNMQSTDSKYDSIGIYLYEDNNSKIKIADVIKCTYNINNEEIEIYSVVKYSNVRDINGLVTLDYSGVLDNNQISLNNDILSFAFGYETLEEVYNKSILSDAKGNIQSKGNVYKAN